MINTAAIQARYRAAVEAEGSTLNRWGFALLKSCSDIPHLLDHIERLRAQVAGEIEAYAVQCLTNIILVSDQMTSCANDHNLAVVETYRQAANIARAGQSYRNPNCTNCYNTRGGLMDHKTEDCSWVPPKGFFEEREQCYGRDLVQVGWMGPYGIIPGGMDNDPAPSWKPIFMRKES